MRTIGTLTIAAALIAAPVASHADGFSYSYAEAGFAQVDIDEVSDKLDGLFLRGSVEITDRFFISADYVDVSTTVVGIDVDYRQYSLGIGGNYPLSDTLDAIGRVAWVKAKAEVGSVGVSEEDDGYSIGAGLRGRLGERFELDGSVAYLDFGGDGGDDVIAAVGARYFFTDRFAVGAEFNRYEDANAWGVGFRVNFGD